MSALNDAIIKIVQLMPKSVVRFFADRYIAGETLDDAVRTVKNLNQRNILATIDVLGEDTNDEKDAVFAANESIDVLRSIKKEKLNSTISVKLTQIGLKINYNVCLNNMREILKNAKENECYVEIDMEDSTCTDLTLQIYKDLRKEFSNCGIVIQAYLKRSEKDIIDLKDILKDSSVRLCKGIYVEDDSIAIKSKQGIRDNYIKLLDLLLKNKIYVGIATHDSYLVDKALEIIKKYSLKTSEYEFQMLYGVKADLREKLVAASYRLRVYIPFGSHWFKYSIRRMKENPDFAMNVMTNIFSKK